MADRVVIRVDASAEIGLGHMMRCLALGQAWQATGVKAVFAVARGLELAEARLVAEGMATMEVTSQPGSVDDAAETEEISRHVRAAWTAIDGYHFGAQFQRLLAKAGRRLLAMDDMARVSHYYADVVVNQNLHAPNLEYACEPHTRLLLGPKYICLRREFMGWRGRTREIPRVARKVLVLMGGSDPDNLTLKVIQALHHVEADNLELVTVLGRNSPHRDAVQRAIARSRVPIRLDKDVDDMTGPMAWADVAVSAGGSSIWELAFMGVPILGLSRAEHEAANLQAAGRHGISAFLGAKEVRGETIGRMLTDLLHDQHGRELMSRAGRSLVDALGSARIVESLREAG